MPEIVVLNRQNMVIERRPLLEKYPGTFQNESILDTLEKRLERLAEQVASLLVKRETIGD